MPQGATRFSFLSIPVRCSFDYYRFSCGTLNDGTDAGGGGEKGGIKNQDGADPVIAPQLFLTEYRIAPNPILVLIRHTRILMIGIRKRTVRTRNPTV